MCDGRCSAPARHRNCMITFTQFRAYSAEVSFCSAFRAPARHSLFNASPGRRLAAPALSSIPMTGGEPADHGHIQQRSKECSRRHD